MRNLFLVGCLLGTSVAHAVVIDRFNAPQHISVVGPDQIGFYVADPDALGGHRGGFAAAGDLGSAATLDTGPGIGYHFSGDPSSDTYCHWSFNPGSLNTANGDDLYVILRATTPIRFTFGLDNSDAASGLRDLVSPTDTKVWLTKNPSPILPASEAYGATLYMMGLNWGAIDVTVTEVGWGFQPVPEPATLVMLLPALALIRRRRS